jgi:hypothetical protein
LTIFLLSLWFAAVFAHFIAAAAMITRRLVAKYPLIFISLLASAILGTFLIAAWVRGATAGYRAAYVATQSWVIATDALLAVGAFISIMRRFPRTTRIAHFATILACLSIFAALVPLALIRKVPIPAWHAIGAASVQFGRYVYVFCAACLLPAVLFRRKANSAHVRPNAALCLDASLYYFLTLLLANVVAVATAGSYLGVVITNSLIPCAGLALCAAFVVRLRAEGERTGPFSVPSASDLRHLAERRADIERGIDDAMERVRATSPNPP